MNQATESVTDKQNTCQVSAKNFDQQKCACCSWGKETKAF